MQTKVLLIYFTRVTLLKLMKQMLQRIEHNSQLKQKR